MYLFQSIVFVLEILFQLIFGVAVIIFSDAMVQGFKGSDVKYVIGKVFSIIIALFMFIHFTVPYLKDLRKLITGKLIYSVEYVYPVNIYLLFDKGIKSWLWVTKYNNAFSTLVLQVLGLLFLFIFNFIEKRKDEEIAGTLVFAQIVAAGNVGSFIYNILRW